MQKTFLNELYHQTDENKSTNNNNITSIKRENKNKFNTINKKQKKNNIIPQSKSSLFLNNFIRLNKKTSYKNESNIIPIFKKRKKKNINVNPYQKMGNEYILNFALDNLNKYQENLLIKEKTEDEKNNFNNNNIDFSNKINYYNNFIITNNENYESSNNSKMNKTVKNFRSSYKNNIKKDKEKENNLPKYFTNNKNYSEYFLSNDLFNDNKKEIENEEIPEPEPYIINKYITKNKSYNNFNKAKINSNQQNLIKNNINNNTDIKLDFTLSNLELKELQKVFEDNFIFFEDLFLLTKEDFVEMKIPIGPRNRLLNFIKKYKNYAKTFDLNELSSFMNKFKESINSNEIDTTIGETPSTNNKYKSTMTTENNKKKLNISNLEEERNEQNNNIIDDLNEIINQNNNNNNNNKRCNTYKTIESRNYNDEDNENENEKDNSNNSNKNTNTNNTNNNNINKNIFSNSLFNEFTSSYGTDLKDSNLDFIDINNLNNININSNNTKNQNKLNKTNPLKIECLNNLISKNNSPFITNNNIINNENNKISNQNIFMNKKNKMQNVTHYKNYQNIFSEIEKYQMNYEKMKKENNDRNNKINNLLDKKNKTNIQYLKMKLKNSKYYNDEDLVNESARDLNKELQKINFFKKGTSSQNNDIKKDKKQNVKNPLIEEFNKHK